MNLNDWRYGKCKKRSCNRLAVCESCLKELLQKEDDDEDYHGRCCE